MARQPRNSKAAAEGRELRALLRAELAKHRCGDSCKYTPAAKVLKAELPWPFCNLTDAAITHHLRLITRGVQ